ncbi:hypothetical protein FKM82_007695 [Ascaphus truei]
MEPITQVPCPTNCSSHKPRGTCRKIKKKTNSQDSQVMRKPLRSPPQPEGHMGKPERVRGPSRRDKRSRSLQGQLTQTKSRGSLERKVAQSECT